jgi:hypothetical protein
MAPKAPAGYRPACQEQHFMKKPKLSWGGARPGAGRPKSDPHAAWKAKQALLAPGGVPEVNPTNSAKNGKNDPLESEGYKTELAKSALPDPVASVRCPSCGVPDPRFCSCHGHTSRPLPLSHYKHPSPDALQQAQMTQMATAVKDPFERDLPVPTAEIAEEYWHEYREDEARRERLIRRLKETQLPAHPVTSTTPAPPRRPAELRSR